MLAETKPDSQQESGFVFFQGCLSVRPPSFTRAALLLTIAKKTLYRSLVYILRQRIRPKPQSETDNSRNSHYDIDTGDDAPDGKSETEPLHRPTEKLMSVARPEYLYFLQEIRISFYLLFITIWL